MTTPHRSATRIGTRLRLASPAVAGALAVALVGCGNVAEKVAEEGIERAIENESGGDVEIDLDGGGFVIESEDGNIRVGEDGSFVVEGPDGEVFTGESDGDGGFVVEGDDGSVVFEGDADNGEFTFQGEDGAATFKTLSEVPDEWPGDVPRPDGLSDVFATLQRNADTLIVSVTGNPAQDPKRYLEAYTAALVGAGFEQTSTFETDDFANSSFENEQWSVSIGVNFSTDDQMVTVSVVTNP